MRGECACGAVKVMINPKPDFIHDCNCSLCRKVGAAWGYFPSARVSAEGATHPYSRTDKGTPAVEVHSCPTCGSTTHFALTESFKADNPDADQMGVNMRLFEPEQLGGIEVRYPDGRAWSGEGAFVYRAPSLVIGESAPW
ncbi:MAG: hypothetical protein V2I43_12410 [Parvularcula sp.]|nr:hypothetical protein [Parvularcula sp.]